MKTNKNPPQEKRNLVPPGIGSPGVGKSYSVTRTLQLLAAMARTERLLKRIEIDSVRLVVNTTVLSARSQPRPTYLHVAADRKTGQLVDIVVNFDAGPPVSEFTRRNLYRPQNAGVAEGARRRLLAPTRQVNRNL